jgi:hypothetical protein
MLAYPTWIPDTLQENVLDPLISERLSKVLRHPKFPRLAYDF